MIKRIIIGSLIALALVGAGIGIGASSDGNWGRHHDAVVVSGGSGTADAGQTIIVSEGHHGFFFPFGLLFFGLFIFLVVSAIRRGGRGGGGCRRGGGGPGSSGGPPWLEDWHRRAHEVDSTTPSPEQVNPA
jgi:hypothetical protein